jgi:steroid delta-isomerase-like uncharacterized protein
VKTVKNHKYDSLIKLDLGIKEENSMTLEENKALVRRVIEAFNKGDVSVLDELVAKDWIYHTSRGQEVLHGIEAYKQVVTLVRKSFPDFNISIEDMVAEGDKVTYRFTMSGTFKGEYRGFPPNNKKFLVWAIIIERIVDGKIVETWERHDPLSMMHQLGLIPPMGKK